MSQRLLWVVLTISVVPVCAFGQHNQRLRDRDPDLAGSKKVLADLQQANFHIFRNWYLMSRIRISDVGFEQSAYVPTGDTNSGISVSVEAPNRLYYRPHQKFVLTVEAIPGYTFGSKRQFNYSTRADAHFLFNHLYLDLYTVGLDQLRAHVSDINRLATVKEKNVGLAGEVKWSSRTSALFNVNYGDTRYPTNRIQPSDINGLIDVTQLDRTERGGRFSFNHKTFPKTSLFVATEVNTYEFRRAMEKDSKRIWYGGGFSWDSGRSQFRAEAGPIKLDFDDPTQRDYTGITGGLGLGRVNGPWGFNGSIERDLGFAITRNNNYYVATIANAGITYQATRRLTLRTNALAERDDFDVPLDGILRRDDISFYSVGGSYGVWRLRFGGDVGWYERDSTVESKESGIRYLVHLSFQP